MRLFNYKLNKDIELNIINYLTFNDIFQFIQIGKSNYKLFIFYMDQVIFNRIITLGYVINKNNNHISIQKTNRVITLENNIIFDEKLLALVKNSN